MCRFGRYAAATLSRRPFSTAGVQTRKSRPLLVPEENVVALNRDVGLDLDATGVPTVAVIGPSRRGKSVLTSLLGGGDPQLFPQSHSSFRAMTSGTHVCVSPCGARIIDTEGLSHIGRSRSSESLVRQLLISTYLTSSHVVWLDNEVLSSSFFTTMWLVHDYVADILRVRDTAGDKMPKLLYVRTQETEVQKREYCNDFADFGAFFEEVMASHEDATILTQMFAPGGIRGMSLPVWTVDDLERYEADEFWHDKHTSPFKSCIEKLQKTVLERPSAAEVEEKTTAPLLALSALEQHLPKIGRLEAFDPRDHETNKVTRLRNYMRGAYGVLKDPPDLVSLANTFEVSDRDVAKYEFDLERVVTLRLEDQCAKMRIEPEIAHTDPEITTFIEQFKPVAKVFRAAVDAFTGEQFTEIAILKQAIQKWKLNSEAATSDLKGALAAAEAQFMAETGLTNLQMRKLNLHQRLKWRVDDSLMRLRGCTAGQLRLQESKDAQLDTLEPSWVWHLGEWQGSAPTDGKTRRAKATEFALWTDGFSWALNEEVKKGKEGRVGVMKLQGKLSEEQGPLPIPLPKSPSAASAHA
eukprot:TRINITY_DN9454_c0_g1_i1.p1 TRINITY_DN9454_c0_g1~~TRINITY_DN9454_c0_g1_i1.p1  ORF type:complete len:580 (-),score=137.90 TRINITY_DN9454_c0_g1_i1:206-1945(-)